MRSRLGRHTRVRAQHNRPHRLSRHRPGRHGQGRAGPRAPAQVRRPNPLPPAVVPQGGDGIAARRADPLRLVHRVQRRQRRHHQVRHGVAQGIREQASLQPRAGRRPRAGDGVGPGAPRAAPLVVQRGTLLLLGIIPGVPPGAAPGAPRRATGLLEAASRVGEQQQQLQAETGCTHRGEARAGPGRASGRGGGGGRQGERASACRREAPRGDEGARVVWIPTGAAPALRPRVQPRRKGWRGTERQEKGGGRG
mmetsp:Transcript_3243/g.8290  ORF Transcript_3243/g.8290 Transcript_3243/m.8290 type:complete len:252 (-) Transcript_3243:1252-2007(-)